MVSVLSYSGDIELSQTKSGSNIQGSTITLSDPDKSCLNTSSCTPSFVLSSTKFYAKLWFEDIEKECYSAWTIDVDFEIEFEDELGNLHPSSSHSLSIDYDPTNPYVDIDIKEFIPPSGMHYIRANIFNVTVNSPISVPNDLHLELLYKAVKYYPLSTCSRSPITSITNNKTTNSLTVNWSSIPQAETYDFEWLFIDAGNDPSWSNSYNYDFSKATRINTSKTSYTISLAYPQGILLFRARPRTPYVTTTTFYGAGNWSNLDNTGILLPTNNYSYGQLIAGCVPSTLDGFKYRGMDTAKNWQYSVSFAEEGKRKEVVSFFDGAMYNRQSVTLSNSNDKKAIVGQTIYDFTGRPALNLMPAPLTSTGIHYYDNRTTTDVSNHPTAIVGVPNDYDNIARNSTNKPYSFKDFDKNPTALGAVPSAAAMSSTASTGAAKYYSTNNTVMGINSGYVPDSEGRPFTRTIYDNDGTNRILRQSGVGETHKIETNQSTRYLYSTPSGRQELDRLFGNEVGNVENYKKNIVLDPNGQGSVSYLDGKGRTIATALIGDAPSNLLQIDTRPATKPVLRAHLSDFNNIINKKELTVSKVITIQKTDNYSFHYSVPASVFSDCGTGNCKYKLTISLKNLQTGVKENLFDISLNSSTTLTTGTIISENVQSATTIDFKANLSFGNYLVVKELKIDQVELDVLIANFIANHTTNVGTCYDYIKPLEIDDCCEYDCMKQYMKVDPLTQERVFYNTTGNKICTFYFDPVARVYTGYPSTPGSIESGYSNTDWLVIKNSIEDCIASCAAPDDAEDVNSCEETYNQLKADMSPDGQYFDALGTSSTTNGWLTDPVLNPQMQLGTFNAAAGVSYTTWDQVRTNWQSCWGNIMVKGHPEYCMYSQYCCVTVNPSDPCDITTTRVEVTCDFTNQYEGIIIQGCTTNITYTDGTLSTASANIILNRLTDEICGYFDNTNFSYQDIANQTNGYNSSSPKYAKYHHPTTGIIGTNSGQMSPAEFIQYHAEKLRQDAIQLHIQNSIILPCPTTIVPSPTNPFLTTGGFKIRTFYSGITQSTTQSSQSVICDQVCQASVQQWISDFECYEGLSTLDQNTFKSLLLQVCTNSCETTHIPGDSYTPGIQLGSSPAVTIGAISFVLGGTPYTATDFRDVLVAFRAYYSTLPDNNIANANICPTPTFAALPANCLRDNIFDFVKTNSGLPHHNLPTAYSSIQTLTGFDIESILHTMTGDPLYTNFDTEYNNLTGGTAAVSTNLPSLLHCSTKQSKPLNQDSICVERINRNNEWAAQQAFKKMLEHKALQWSNDYVDFCISQAKQGEEFYYDYELDEYHYTLYFYDQADNLIKTVPPEGIYQKKPNPVNDFDATDFIDLANVQNHRVSPTTVPFVHPVYAMWTNYKYNSLNQLIEQTTPDGNTSVFFYDKLGRLIASQNSEQASRNAYSNTEFDDLGRIKQVKEIINTPPLTDVVARDIPSGSWSTWQSTITSATQQVTTTYDVQLLGIPASIVQNNLRNRIATVTYDKDGDGNYESASHYDYDINGNVKTIYQENKEQSTVSGQELKRIDYQYDLVSGNVNKVSYQEGQDDQFYHKYEYDADNRLTVAYTSRNNILWEKESKNLYYAHGPLARVELGDKQVQALDYAYTLQGWLKAINSSMGHNERDIGEDGNLGTVNENFGRDVFGLSLHYFDNDYQQTGSITPGFLASLGTGAFYSQGADLYNGNISRMIVGLTDHNQNRAQVIGNTYRYDQLNRIKEYTPFLSQDDQNDMVYAQNDLDPSDLVNSRYQGNYSYDGNGNITNLLRNGSERVAISPLPNPSTPMDPSNFNWLPVDMDEFIYNYPNTNTIAKPGGGNVTYHTDNRLGYVEDLKGKVYATDLDNQTGGNYSYDQIGRLKTDVLEGITDIEWNVANKITKITKNTGQIITFKYDPMGNRISKTDDNGSGIEKTTYYVRDAQGNVMATYTNTSVDEDASYKLNDFHIYGSSRLGTKTEDLLLTSSIPSLDLSYRKLGTKRFELSNHLGNVLEVISDRKINSCFDERDDNYFTAQVIAFSDYYPFGMLMPNRHGSPADGYRYGFNGMEKDDEVRGTKGASYTTEFRQYDPRIGRWVSLDPMSSTFPWQSPYVAFDNNPIYFNDPQGLAANGPDDDVDEIDLSGNEENKLELGDAPASEWSSVNKTNSSFDKIQQEQEVESVTLSVKTYIEDWESRHGRKMTIPLKKSLQRGCIGVTLCELGISGDYQPPLDNSFSSFEQAKEFKDNSSNSSELIIFSLRFYSGTSADYLPDENGKVDMKNYNYKSRPSDASGHYTNFDYGYHEPSKNKWWHANHREPGMEVYRSTLNYYSRPLLDFNRQVFVVAKSYALEYEQK